MELLAEALLGRFFSRTKKHVTRILVLNWYLYLVHTYSPRFFKHSPAMPLKTNVAAPGSTNSDDLQQDQHEKASLLFVRAQSPSGLALVPCALNAVDLSGLVPFTPSVVEALKLKPMIIFLNF